ncbi:Gfo/Idh/MocA family oxidoreductase [candidate division KSB1 bacterium]
MKSRREFLKDVGKGVLTAAAVSTVGTYTKAEPKKNIRIGIIGAENSHSYGYGKLFNVKKKYPGVEVLYIWGETDKFAKIAAEKGSIPNIVKNPKEMMGKIDALIVDHRHPKYHLEPALPFVKAGIPTFIDKPFCYRVSEGKEFLRIAREKKTPVSSYSGISQSEGVLDMKAQVAEMNDILQIISYGPCSVDSKYGGVFFYGVHTVQPLMTIFGDDIVEVKVTKSGTNTTAGLVFESGHYATIILVHRSTGMYQFESFLLRKKQGLVKFEPRIKEEDSGEKAYDDMVEMFRTGKEPRSHNSIIRCVAVLEALEKSVNSQKWEKVIV